MAVRAAGYGECADAEIVIVTAGAKQRPEETRMQLLDRNVAITGSIVGEVTKSGSDSVFLVVTNPVDGHVLGEHGNTSFPAWSTVTIGGESLVGYSRLRPELTRPDSPLSDIGSLQEEAKRYVREAAGTIIRGKGSTFYAVAQAVAVIVESVLRDEHRILPISHVRDWRGSQDVAFSYPAVVGGGGVVSTQQYDLDPNEQAQLDTSVRFISENCAGLA